MPTLWERRWAFYLVSFLFTREYILGFGGWMLFPSPVAVLKLKDDYYHSKHI